MDPILFLKAQEICVTALIDMWAELFQLDDDGKDAMTIINELTNKNLAKLIVTRSTAHATCNVIRAHSLPHA